MQNPIDKDDYETSLNTINEITGENNQKKIQIETTLNNIIDKLNTITNSKENFNSFNNKLEINEKIFIENKLEKILRQNIKFNAFLQSSNKEEINKINTDIIKKYNRITGINISNTSDNNLKIDFNFLSREYDYYIILSIKNGKYNIVKISPEKVNFQKYLEELNSNGDINLFLCKLINFELIPYYQNQNKTLIKSSYNELIKDK